MKSCIVGATHNISESLSSHKAAWARMWYEHIKLTDPSVEIIFGKVQDLGKYDRVYIDQGMEFSGSLNLFGGANDISWASRLLSIKGSIVSLDQDLADYGALGKTRLKACSEDWRNFDWDALSEVCSRSTTLTQASRKTGKLCFGDSHSFSALPSMDYMSCRNDGLTLHGALNRGFTEYIGQFGELTHLTVYLGNIDIRHHLCRQEFPLAAAEKLVGRLEEELKKLKIPHIEIVCPLPIEAEERVLPKTGWYKGTPFCGNWQAREDVRKKIAELFSTVSEKNSFELYQWQKRWYSMPPVKFMELMERPRSVHLALENYRWFTPDQSLESFF